MLYIRFLNLQNPLQDVEKLYNDGTIKQGDIVCQQYNDKYSHLFMNGTWVKTKYTSKIAQNTEIEDDVKTLYDSISNNSTNIRDISTKLSNISTNLSNISTNLSDNYITKSQYLEDEELIASSFAYVNNKINAQTEDISTKLSNYITKSQYLKDEKLIASTFADVNNKINSLYAEIAELKEQLKSSTK